MTKGGDMFKKYLLATADAATACGFIVPLVFFTLLCLLFLALGIESAVVAVLIAAVLGGIVGMYVQTGLREKYIVHVDDYCGNMGSSTRVWLLKKMPNGAVVSGKRFWGKENVVPVVLPWVGEDGEFSIVVSLRHSYAGVRVVTVGVTLTFRVLPSEDELAEGVLPNGFVARELWDMAEAGSRNDLELCLTRLFLLAAEKTPAITEAFLREQIDAYKLALAIREVLPKVGFQLPFSNILSVTASLNVSGVRFSDQDSLPPVALMTGEEE